jgi:hypothetical protein
VRKGYLSKLTFNSAAPEDGRFKILSKDMIQDSFYNHKNDKSGQLSIRPTSTTTTKVTRRMQIKKNTFFFTQKHSIAFLHPWTVAELRRNSDFFPEFLRT